MESFDQSLKYLLQHQPADFIRFGLGDPSVEVIRPVPSGLPSRGRDVDGGYVITRGGKQLVAHIEFHRRHQSLEELATDVAEAQVRLFRRERLLVSSLVWDLYGKRDEPVLKACKLSFGTTHEEACSQCVYQRVNLRGSGWAQFLASAPAALWPLVPLTWDGASGEGVTRARDIIEGRAELPEGVRADHLAVLWFMTGAEGVPAQIVRSLISEGRLMESELYRSVLEKGEVKGEARGEARNKAETIIRILIRRMGTLDAAIRETIRRLSDVDTLNDWYEDAIDVVDTEGARKLADKIQKVSPPQATP